MSEFEEGFMFAIACIVRLHDCPTIASDALLENGYQNLDISNMDKFDTKELLKLNKENGVNLTCRN